MPRHKIDSTKTDISESGLDFRVTQALFVGTTRQGPNGPIGEVHEKFTFFFFFMNGLRNILVEFINLKLFL